MPVYNRIRVHLTVNGEEIVTTVDHPFYVKDQGFVNAGELVVGNELLDSYGNVLFVEDFEIELTDEPVKVYNFQVEDFHTYHVGENGILIHNANYDEAVDIISKDSEPGRKTKGKTEIKIKDGGFDDTLKDFDAVDPSESRTINTQYGEGKTGILDDGSTITARPGSSDGRPTLEIRKPNGRGVEVRYGEQSP